MTEYITNIMMLINDYVQELIWPHNSIRIHLRALLRATLALVAQNLLWVGVYDVCERQFSVLRARTVCDPPRSLAPLHGSCAFVLDPRTGKVHFIIYFISSYD